MKRALLAFVIMLTLSSCQLGLFQTKGTVNVPVVSIGTQGVEPVLTQNTPPREVFEGGSFSMIVTLANLGTADVDQGVYSLSYDPQYLYLPRQQATGSFAARGKSTFNPRGGEKQLNFVFDTKPLGPQLQGYPATLTFTACYPYETSAPLIVCIDTDIMGKQTNKACTPQTQSFGSGEGAPVAVATVETRMLPHEDPNRIRPEFVLTLRNLGGGGLVASQYYREACSGRPLGEDAWNVVSVDAALSDTVLTCTPTPVKVKQTGDTRVICTLPEGIPLTAGTYTSPLTVTVGYGYLKSINAQVNLVKPNI